MRWGKKKCYYLKTFWIPQTKNEIIECNVIILQNVNIKKKWFNVIT